MKLFELKNTFILCFLIIVFPEDVKTCLRHNILISNQDINKLHISCLGQKEEVIAKITFALLF